MNILLLKSDQEMIQMMDEPKIKRIREPQEMEESSYCESKNLGDQKLEENSWMQRQDLDEQLHLQDSLDSDSDEVIILEDQDGQEKEEHQNKREVKFQRKQNEQGKCKLVHFTAILFSSLSVKPAKGRIFDSKEGEQQVDVSRRATPY